MTQKKILIVGGGVAGLTLAGFIEKYNIGKAVIVEQAQKFGTIGFLIGLWGNGRKILKEIGIDKDIVEDNGHEILSSIFEDSKGKLLKKIDFRPFRKFGHVATITRASLQEGLVSKLGNTEVRFGTKVENLDQLGSGGVRVKFSDGKEGVFDLVVGADGSHSWVRENIFGKNFLKYYGWGVWVYWLPESYKHTDEVIEVAGDGKMYALFPSPTRPIILFVAKIKTTSNYSDKRIPELKNLFSKFEGRAKEVLGLMPGEKDVFYNDLMHVNMPHWYKGRVALAGDSQHATCPISGMGASMAMEDAFVLADELKKNNDVDIALKNYQNRRKGRIKRFKKAAERIDNWTMAAGLGGKLRDTLLPFLPISFFLKSISNLLEEEI